MKRTVKIGDIFFEENNGTYYEVLGRYNESLYSVRTYLLDENDEPCDEENGYLTTSEIQRSGLKLLFEGEGEIC